MANGPRAVHDHLIFFLRYLRVVCGDGTLMITLLSLSSLYCSRLLRRQDSLRLAAEQYPRDEARQTAYASENVSRLE